MWSAIFLSSKSCRLRSGCQSWLLLLLGLILLVYYPRRCPSLSCPLDSLPPGGQAVPGYLTPRPGYLNPRGTSCPGRFILPPAHIKKILLCDVYYYLQHYNNYMQFLSYNYVNLNDYFKHSVGFLIDKGWGASCPGRFILPPAKDFKENG